MEQPLGDYGGKQHPLLSTVCPRNAALMTCLAQDICFQCFHLACKISFISAAFGINLLIQHSWFCSALMVLFSKVLVLPSEITCDFLNGKFMLVSATDKILILSNNFELIK